MKSTSLIFAAFALLLSIFFLIPSPQYGNPVSGEKIILFQPDGTQIIGYVYGDEFHHRVETEEGYTIMLNEETGYIEYALLKGRKLVPSGMVVGTVSPLYLERLNFPKHLTDRASTIDELRTKSPERFHDFGSWQGKVSRVAGSQALTGTLKVFVACVQFQPESSPPINWYSGTYPPAGFGARLLNTGLSEVTMANYYKANSYGQFYPVGYTYPNWVTLPRTASWYEDNSSWQQIIRDAMDEIMSQNPNFDFTQYANNGDLDVIVIWAGTTQGWGDFYWPHMSSGGFTRHGVRVRYYNAVNERLGTGVENTDIGVFCHEYGHMTGSPDLYDYSSFNKVVGYYCMMAWSNPGTNICGYLKWKNYGWIIPTLISSSGWYDVDALGLAAVTNPRLYQIMIDSPKEYLLVENRFNGADPNYENYSARWSGLLITHVDENYPSPAEGQPAYTFYGLEAIVPVLDPTITMLSFYTSYFSKMVWAADNGGYSRLDPFFPDNRAPGSFLTLTHEDGVEHVIYRNTQGHTKSSNIYFVGISNSGSTMRFPYNVQMYTISGNVASPLVSLSGRVHPGMSRRALKNTGKDFTLDESVTRKPGVERLRTKGVELSAASLGNVVMSGFPGNPASDGSGNYSALVPELWSGIVTPTKVHYTFVPPNKTFINVASDLSNQNFIASRNIYAPSFFEVETKLNRSLSQAEYINVLTWYRNLFNENIVKYRIYLVENGNHMLLVEVDGEVKEYWHRNVEKDRYYKYAIAAVNNEGREGEYAYAEINQTSGK